MLLRILFLPIFLALFLIGRSQTERLDLSRDFTSFNRGIDSLIDYNIKVGISDSLSLTLLSTYLHQLDEERIEKEASYYRLILKSIALQTRVGVNSADLLNQLQILQEDIQNTNDTILLAEYLLVKGWINVDAEHIEVANKNFKEAAWLARKQSASAVYNDVVFALGYCAEVGKNFSQALECYNEILTHPTVGAKGDLRLVETTLHIGNVYYVLKEYEKAIAHYQLGLKKGKTLNVIRLISLAEYHLGKVYENAHQDATQAILHYKNSLKYIDDFNLDQKFIKRLLEQKIEKLHPNSSIKLKPTWICNGGFENVESVVYDSTNEVIYASNGKEYKPGTDGFISKIAKTGKLLKLKWVENLSRPTGMAIWEEKLYVADVDALLIIDTKNGKVLQRIKAPIENPGLNDVAITSQGEVYITASFIHAVLKLEKGQLLMWRKKEEQLKWANGVAVEKDKLIVGGLSLNYINVKTKKIEPIKLSPTINDFDGISSNGKNGYYLSTVEPGGLWFCNKEKQIIKLKKDEAYFGDLEYLPSLDLLIVARGNHQDKNYFLEAFSIQ